MASLPLERPATIVTLPGTIPPMPAVARILGRYDRSQVDGTNAEDELPRDSSVGSGPGCIISDPDTAVDDEGCDADVDREEDGVWFGIDQDARRVHGIEGEC